MAVACQLAQRGGNVTLFARNQAKLDLAVKQVQVLLLLCAAPHEAEIGQGHTVNPNQQVEAVSVDLTDPASCTQAFDKAETLQGRPVDLLISCVGAAGPTLGLFKDLTPEQFRAGMDTNYFATLWTVQVCTAYCDTSAHIRTVGMSQ